MGSPQSVTFGYEIGVEFTNKHRYSFDITDAVQSWVSDATAKSKGILFKATDALESGSANTYRTIASYNRSSNKPSLSVTFNYASDGITSATGKDNVDEGALLQLTANGMEGTVTWKSSNTSIATVSSTGIVTGRKAGQVTITASCPDYEDATFFLYVTVPDGIYYIKNASSGLCLENSDSGINLNSQQVPTTTRIPQLWKITYIAQGKYSVRPLKDISQGLKSNATSSTVSVTDCSILDTNLTAVYKWAIRWNTFGYYFCNQGFEAKTLQPSDAASGASLTATAWSATLSCHWTLENVKGVFLRNPATHEHVPLSTVKYIDIGDSKSISSLGIAPEVYGSTNADVTWSSGDTSIATVNSAGNVTGVAPGKVAITASKSINGTLYTVSYYVFVKPIVDGTYFIRNKALANYVQIDDNADNYSSSGEILELWDFDGADYQGWIFTHLSDGYYKIISTESGLAITVQSQYLDVDEKPLVQTSYVGSYNQQWKITVTQTGSYIIRPRSAEALDTDWCMSAGWTMGGANGLNVEQRAYTSDADHKDEWHLHRIKSVVNLDVLYDDAYLSRYSNAPSRIQENLKTLQQKYLEEFGIWVNYSNPSVFSCYADLNCTTNHNASCSHADETECRDSFVSQDGCLYLFNSHHTNIYNIFYRIPTPDTDITTRIAFIGHETCEMAPGGCRPSTTYGLTATYLGLITVTNFISKSQEIKTTVHEFGHLFGVDDHYGNGTPTTQNMLEQGKQGYSMMCIYGEGKDTEEVYENLLICDGCRAIIEANIHWYDHD